MPGLRLLAADLRSQRRRRRIMGDEGWLFVERSLANPLPQRLLMMSSVPLLGPRLSLLESLLILAPKLQKYEDDLRDQWQSRAHRKEWRRMLRTLRDAAVRDGADVTVLSGEIHLATQADMPLGDDRRLVQLVASGVAHRAPPRAWATLLGAIAALGESPLQGHPIAIRPLPGRQGRYVAQRNTLTLRREGDLWDAVWDLEESGPTPALPL